MSLQLPDTSQLSNVPQRITVDIICLKYIAVCGLSVVCCSVVGFFIGPLILGPLDPTVVAGEVQAPCGLQVLAYMFWCGASGGVLGLPIGLILAWRLPTPA